MKSARVVVPWEEGLHLRPAAELVKGARGCRSSILLRACGRVADARNILSIVLLCAAAGTPVEVEANGDDEDQAIALVERVFAGGLDSRDLR